MCRKKKIKCDGKMPACTHCINYKTECVFTQVEKKRNPPKGYVDSKNTSSRTLLTSSQSQVYRRTRKSIRKNGKLTEVVGWVLLYFGPTTA